VGGKTIYHEKWYASTYDRDRFGEAFGGYLEQEEIVEYLSLVDGHKGKILDVGTGTGKLSMPFVVKGREVISSDLSMEMLEIAKLKGSKKGVQLKGVICDAQDLCFENGAFECVICSRVLMHLRNWKKGLSELCRVANVVVLDFPPMSGFSGLDSLIKRSFGRFIKRIRKYRVLRVGSVKTELERHGFYVVALKKRFFLPIAFHRGLNNPLLSSKMERIFAKLGLISIMGAPVTIKAVKRPGCMSLSNETEDRR
jgi:ubiquinone/menaquinone biosynthesis C-methylase UbiE